MYPKLLAWQGLNKKREGNIGDKTKKHYKAPYGISGCPETNQENDEYHDTSDSGEV